MTWSPQGTALMYEGSEQKLLCGIIHEWGKRGEVATLQLTAPSKMAKVPGSLVKSIVRAAVSS